MVQTKKSLGQHFLRDRRVLLRIADAAKLSRTDTVLEVGPGEGALTELLLNHAGRVIAVEKDARLIPVLREKFSGELASGKLALIHADILTFDARCAIHDSRYKIVANLPYYITGQFLRKFLGDDCQPTSMTLLLQKEVARRIACLPHEAEVRRRQVATDKRESILSISVKAYGFPRYIATVKAQVFHPRPKVDSAIITIENISKDFFREPMAPPPELTRSNPVRKAEEHFFTLLKKGFAHPRKLLASNLGVPPEALTACGVPPKARAETLSLEQWKCLTASSL